MKKLVVLILTVFMVLVAGCGNKDTSCKFKLPSNVAKNVTSNESYVIQMYPDNNKQEKWNYHESPVNNEPIYNKIGAIPIFDNPSKEHPTTEADLKYLTNTIVNLSKQFQERVYGKVLDKHTIHWCQIQSMYEEDVILICYTDGCVLRALVNTQSEYKYISIDGDGNLEHKVRNSATINEELSK